jgi:2-keto-4-pentenoate hydratase
VDDVLSEEQQARAAQLLWQLWQEGGRIPALPDELRPSTRADGYAIQARLERRTKRTLLGWKIAATSAAGQAHIGVDGPLAGRLIVERAFPDGATLNFGANHMRVVEPEFAFRMGQPLAPRAEPYSVDEVMAAVDTLHPALEVPDSRYDDFAAVGAPQLIADDACAHEFVLGPAVRRAWRSHDLAGHAVFGAVTGGTEREGSGANVLGDPRVALAWLANELSGLGIPLRAGQVVTTGTCMKPLEVEPGDAVSADFGAFGRVRLRFGDR